MKFKDLKRGDIIRPAKSWQWPNGYHIVEAVHEHVVYVVNWSYSNCGVGNLYKESWRSHMYGGSLDENELKQFNEFVEEKFKRS